MHGHFPTSARTSGVLSIRAHLIAFALALIVPIIGFAGFLVWRSAKAEEARVVEAARQVTDQATVAIDRELTGIIATAQALATSPLLPTGQFAAFHRQAAGALRIGGSHIAVRDGAGRTLLTTRLPWGGDLPADAPPDSDRQVITRLEPVVSGLLQDPATKRYFTAVNVPVFSSDTVTHVLELSVPADHWLRVLEQTLSRSNWSAGLIDRSNVFVARLRSHEHYVGTKTPDDLALLEGTSGVLQRTNVEGEPVLFAYRRSMLAGWLLGIGVPTDVVQEPWRRSLAIIVAAGLALFAASLVMAAAFGSRIARPLQRLSAAAAQLGRGEAVPPLVTGLAEVNEVGKTLAAAGATLRDRDAALRISEERYRLATEAFQGAVFDYDVAADHSNRTPRHAQLLGEEPGAIPAAKAGWQDRIHPEDRPHFEAARRRVYQEGAPQYEAEYRVRRRDGSWIWVWHRALALRGEGGAVRRVVGAVLDITARREAEEHQRLLIHELNHRVKNTLATVQSIAAQTLRGAASVGDARSAFEARLIALSRAHNILTRENWEGADLHDVVTEVLEPHRAQWEDRFRIEGPAVWVAPGNAVSIAMGMHELATNAAKYGALTSEAGHVHVRWTIEPGAAGERVRLVWAEAGGPGVAPPARRGFGSRLIERSLAADLGGEAHLDFRPEGLVCTLVWALDGREAPVVSYPARSFGRAH
ncbi:MAG TPA: HWE histidine kinase domain-containing protein [Microvirga sp.]|jgi:PAS domain S-box-containing protein